MTMDSELIEKERERVVSLISAMAAEFRYDMTIQAILQVLVYVVREDNLQDHKPGALNQKYEAQIAEYKKTMIPRTDA